MTKIRDCIKNVVAKNKAVILSLAVIIFFSCCWVAVRLGFRLYCAIFLAATCGILGLILLCYWMIKTNRFAYYKIYPFIGLFLGMVYCINLPVYTVPDEGAHMQKAYHMSNQLLGIGDKEVDGEIYLVMREKDADFSTKKEGYTGIEFADYLKETYASDSEKLVETNGKVMSIESYPYIASSLGITLGRILHLSALKTFLLGRMFNLVLFVVIISVALWLIPWGKPVIFTVALLPMSIQEGMSYSYDSWVIAHSLLLVAVFLSLYEDIKAEKSKRFYIRLAIMAVVSILLAPIKSHGYILLCALLVFILLRLFLQEERVNNTIGFLISFSYIGFIFGYGILFVLGLIKPDLFHYSKHILEWSGTEGYTIGFLLHNPKEAIGVMYNTMVNQFEYYHRTMIGDLLGWLEKPMNSLVIVGFDIVLIFSALKEKNQKETDGILRKIFLWIFIFTFILINVGMLLSWSPVEVHQVVGLQGRYFLPVLAVLLLSFRSARLEVDKDLKAYVPLMVLVLQFFAISGLMNLTL